MCQTPMDASGGWRRITEAIGFLLWMDLNSIVMDLAFENTINGIVAAIKHWGKLLWFDLIYKLFHLRVVKISHFQMPRQMFNGSWWNEFTSNWFQSQSWHSHRKCCITKIICFANNPDCNSTMHYTNPNLKVIEFKEYKNQNTKSAKFYTAIDN